MEFRLQAARDNHCVQPRKRGTPNQEPDHFGGSVRMRPLAPARLRLTRRSGVETGFAVMRTFLQNILITFALALCVLVVIQWHRESELRRDADRLATQARKDQAAIDSLRQNLTRAGSELSQAEYSLKQLAESGATSRAELERATAELKRVAAELVSHKAALTQANENIVSQNATMKRLADERNETVARFNKLVEDHNALVKKWNEQQEQNAGPAQK